MFGVLQGFGIILSIMLAGYLTAYFGVVKGEQRRVLNNVAFYVATPSLLFGVLYRSEPQVVFSPVILVIAATALLTALIYVVISMFRFKNDLSTKTLGATTSSYVNSNNLGLPVAIYILGDAAYIAPLILLQVIVFVPIILVLLESARGGSRGFLPTLARTIRNPILVASVLGLLCAVFELRLPEPVLAPLDMLGGAAIPMVLLSFGISLRGQRALEAGGPRAEVFTATVIKVLVSPLVAWALSHAFGLSPHETFVATTIAALPTAQNIYNYAATYRRAETMVRDTIFLSTFASLPVIAGIAWLLAA